MFVARAPGKLVGLGEYAVLDGAPALVLAIDRNAEARIAPSADDECHLRMLAPELTSRVFVPAAGSGVGLVDLVTAAVAPPMAWRATLDSAAFFAGTSKLGLGSSAAVLCAWAGAFAAFARRAGVAAPPPDLGRLIDLHRAFQGGKGSGLDVAASLTGGAITFQLGADGMPQVGSVQLPNGVGFAGIFAGRSASTPELVAHYRAWRRERPREASAIVSRLAAVAEAGCAAARGNDAGALVGAFADYGRALQNLGDAIGAEIVTAEHRQIGEHAQRFGVAYKVSGAGGGDLGLACAEDGEALAAFTESISSRGFRVIKVSLAKHGLVVEQHAEEPRGE